MIGRQGLGRVIVVRLLERFRGGRRVGHFALISREFCRDQLQCDLASWGSRRMNGVVGSCRVIGQVDFGMMRSEDGWMMTTRKSIKS